MARLLRTGSGKGPPRGGGRAPRVLISSTVFRVRAEVTRLAEGVSKVVGCIFVRRVPPKCLSALGSRVQGSRVQGAGFRVQGSGIRDQGPGFRAQGSGFRVQGLVQHMRCVCVPLQHLYVPTSERRRTNSADCEKLIGTPRPKSGLECLMCVCVRRSARPNQAATQQSKQVAK